MTELKKQLGIIGGGNMGEAFAGAMIETGAFGPDAIVVSDVSVERLEYLKERYGVRVCRDNFEAFHSSTVVVLAVKPQQMDAVLGSIVETDGYGVRERKTVISIAAGITIERIEKLLYANLDEASRKKMPVVRVMPNTPALVLAGMSGMSANANALPEEIESVEKMLGAMGEVVVLDESRLNAVTAVSGSGPAYVFYLIESMIDAATAVGLDPLDARTLTLNTIKGAVKLMEVRKEPAEELRRKVTSPGGTTEAALKVLVERGFRQAVVDAVAAAAKRAEELSG